MCPPWILCPRDPNRPELPWPLRLLLFPRAISCSTCMTSQMRPAAEQPFAQGEEELHLIQVPSARALSVWQNLHGQHSHTHLPGHQRSPTFKEGLIMEAGMRNMG